MFTLSDRPEEELRAGPPGRGGASERHDRAALSSPRGSACGWGEGLPAALQTGRHLPQCHPPPAAGLPMTSIHVSCIHFSLASQREGGFLIFYYECIIRRTDSPVVFAHRADVSISKPVLFIYLFTRASEAQTKTDRAGKPVSKRPCRTLQLLLEWRVFNHTHTHIHTPEERRGVSVSAV